jgi:hypothetical protein
MIQTAEILAFYQFHATADRMAFPQVGPDNFWPLTYSKGKTPCDTHNERKTRLVFLPEDRAYPAQHRKPRKFLQKNRALNLRLLKVGQQL